MFRLVLLSLTIPILTSSAAWSEEPLTAKRPTDGAANSRPRRRSWRRTRTTESEVHGPRRPLATIAPAGHRRNDRRRRPAVGLGGDRAGRSTRRTPPHNRLAKRRCRSSARPKRPTSKPSPRRSFRPTTRPVRARPASCYFIDRALATFLSQLAGDYRAQLAEFQAAFRERHPGAASFASLTSEQQIEYLKTVDHTPFFEHDAAAHAPRHVLDAGIRRQSRRRRLEAHRLRGPACLPAAVRLLRPRLSGLRRRSGDRRNERAHVSGLRDASTSSSSAPARRAASSRGSWRRRDSRSCCSSRGRDSRRRRSSTTS